MNEALRFVGVVYNLVAVGVVIVVFVVFVPRGLVGLTSRWWRRGIAGGELPRNVARGRRGEA